MVVRPQKDWASRFLAHPKKICHPERSEGPVHFAKCILDTP